MFSLDIKEDDIQLYDQNMFNRVLTVGRLPRLSRMWRRPTLSRRRVSLPARRVSLLPTGKRGPGLTAPFAAAGAVAVRTIA